MRFFQSIETDAHIGKADLLQLGRNLPGDECTVRGNHRTHSLVRRVLRQFQQVFPHQRFTAGEQNHRRVESCQIIDHFFPFFRCQLVGIIEVGGAGIAVNALQITAACHVPDHHRLFVR